MKNKPREKCSDNQRERNNKQSNDIRRMFDHDGHKQTIQRLSDHDQPGEEGESFEGIEDLTALIINE